MAICVFFRFNGAEFLSAASSNYPHLYTSLGKIDEGLVAISGGTGGSSSNIEVEIFSNGNWYLQPAFPETKYFRYYSTTTFENILYVFGKSIYKKNLNNVKPIKFLGGLIRSGKAVTIGRMTDLGLEWTKGPDLLLARYGHRSISIGNEIYIIGGSGNLYVIYNLIFVFENFKENRKMDDKRE